MNIRGPKDDVDKAKKLLVNLSNEKQLSSLTAEVRAKPEHHKFLIGRQGKFMRYGGGGRQCLYKNNCGAGHFTERLPNFWILTLLLVWFKHTLIL